MHILFRHQFYPLSPNFLHLENCEYHTAAEGIRTVSPLVSFVKFTEWGLYPRTLCRNIRCDNINYSMLSILGKNPAT